MVTFVFFPTSMAKLSVFRGNVRFITRVFHVMIIQKSLLDRLILVWNAILGWVEFELGLVV